MARVFDRFDDTTIGPDLIATDGGLLLSTSADALSISRTARGSVFHNAGVHGVELTFYGDAALVAAIGLAQETAVLSAAVGATADSVGWRLDLGEVKLDGATVLTGLPIPAKGDIVAVMLAEEPGPDFYARFYLDGALVGTVALTAGPAWAFAASLSAPVAGELTAALNAGQWPARGDAAYAGWRPVEVATETVRLADMHWMTANDDSPANTRYEGRIASAGVELLQSVGFWPWQDAVSPRGAAAVVTAYDPQGLLAALDVDGTVRVRVRTGAAAGTLAEADDVAQLVLDGIEVIGDDMVRLRLRDAHDDLDEPINPGVFLPNIAALAWQPQPLVIGAVCSVPLLAANGDGTVGFLADSPLAEVSAVLDRGDALEPGTWSVAPGDQQLLLESPPLGPVLADVSSIGAGMSPATLQQAMHQVFSRIRKSSWNDLDAESIDTATEYQGIGYYVGGAVASARQARDAMLANYGAACWQDASGLLRFSRLIDPETVAADVDLPQSMVMEDMTWVYDSAPNLTRRMGYQPNAARMSASDFVTDLVDVPMSRRIELMRPYRGMVYSSVPLHFRYAAAERRQPFPSMFFSRADAQAELDRICGLYSVQRRFYSWRGQSQSALSLTPGMVVNVRYDRYGLEGGRNMLVVSVQRNPSTGRFSLRLWGA